MLPSLLFVIACGTSPALLSGMGDVDATVVYRSSNGVADGSTEVSLVAREGCPTFLGEALMNDEPMVVDDGGHSDLQWLVRRSPFQPRGARRGGRRRVHRHGPRPLGLLADRLR